MLTRNILNKIIDIRLEGEKFYFPGEIIKGFVIVQPKNSIKVNSIQLKFSGQVYINLKEKQVNTLFQESLVLSVHPNSTTPKQTILDTTEHTFPFTFVVPKDLALPSSMEFGKKAHIRYSIHALLVRPMMLESLCPKADYIVSLLEHIDIETQQFRIPQEKSQQVIIPKAKYNQKCIVKAAIPRLGFTRGDIVSLKVTIDHFTSYTRKNGLIVDLVRTVEIRTSRHTVFKETVLKSNQYDILLSNPPYHQLLNCQLLVPTSTPPSIRYKDKVIRFHYRIRISFTINGNDTLDIPITIGTWPRGSIPIDDDYENFEDDNDDETVEIESLRTSSIDGSSITLTPRNSFIQVDRSDSLNSRVSNNSTCSNRSLEQHHHLTRNTSSLSNPDRLPSYQNYNSTEYPYYHNHRQRQSLPPLAGPNYRRNHVPTHILEPIQSIDDITTNTSMLDIASESEDSLDSDDEDDLLAIIEKKKRKEKKALRKQQQQLAA